MDTQPAVNRIPSLARYTLLGRSGLRVSPFCLGTMTFGNEAGWGSSEATARSIFDRYLEAGGNFLDTADLYTGGDSERMLGKFMKDANNRASVVLATKFTFNQRPGDPNAGGNGRKHIMEAIEGSLRRLATDYIDLYWLHAWDQMTPEEEVMSTLDTLVRQGKVRYIGLSNTPGWYVASCQRLAESHGWTPLSALQLEYSMVERTIEREHVGAALHFGLGICPWSPLASGFLSGKYTRENREGGRLTKLSGGPNPVFQKFTERNFEILDALLAVAKELGRPPAQVALNWTTRRPGITSTIIGATKIEQLNSTLEALEFEIPKELAEKLDKSSAPPLGSPYMFFGPDMRGMQTGGCEVSSEPAWYRG